MGLNPQTAQNRLSQPSPPGIKPIYSMNHTLPILPFAPSKSVTPVVPLKDTPIGPRLKNKSALSAKTAPWKASNWTSNQHSKQQQQSQSIDATANSRGTSPNDSTTNTSQQPTKSSTVTP